MRIQLMVDSSSDLPSEIVSKYGIKIVPLSVNFGEESFLDRVEINSKTFYERLAVSEKMPTTSQVPPERFMTYFKEALDEHKQVLCITLGANASGTCQSAYIAQKTLASNDVHILDSNALCMGTGYMAIVAAEMIDKGKTIEEILEVLKPLTDNKIEHLFCVDTLEFLKKGGRIKASKAVVAEILNIKPILKAENAITQPLHKVRGRKKIIPYYLNKMKTDLDYDRSPFLCIAHSQDEKFAKEFYEAIRTELKWTKPIYISEIGATIGTHTGPGVLAVFYIKKQ